jgi:surfactin synthase thioesterase subunit
VKQIPNWGRFTRSGFKSQILEGGHFFIHKHPGRIADSLTAYNNQVAVP